MLNISTDKVRHWHAMIPTDATVEKKVRLALLPDWLERSLVKIQRTNAGLKKIAREKEVRSLSMFQKRAKSKKAKPATGWKEEPVDQVLAPRDNDIGTAQAKKKELNIWPIFVFIENESLSQQHQTLLSSVSYCSEVIEENTKN